MKLFTCLLAASHATSVAFAAPSLADRPYVETVPFQFVYKGVFPKAPLWGELPESCCLSQVEAVATASNTQTNAHSSAALRSAKRSHGQNTLGGDQFSQEAGPAQQRTVLKFQSGGVYLGTRSSSSSAEAFQKGDANAAYTISPVDTSEVEGSFLKSDPSAKLLVQPGTGEVLAVVASSGIVPVKCTWVDAGRTQDGATASSHSCTSAGASVVDFKFGSKIVDVSYSGTGTSGVAGAWSFLVLSDTGVFRVESDGAFPSNVVVKTLRSQTGLTSLAMTPFTSPQTSSRTSGTETAFVAGQHHLYTFNAVTGAATHEEWIGNVTSGAGGAVDGPVAAMAFDPADQTVLLGTEAALNTIAPTLRLTRTDGRHGLPYGNITAFASRTTTDSTMGALATAETQLWAGTRKGLMVFQQSGDPQWRYLYGPRWHPGHAIEDLAVHAGSQDGAVPATVVAATDGGVVFLEEQLWTLAVSALFN